MENNALCDQLTGSGIFYKLRFLVAEHFNLQAVLPFVYFCFIYLFFFGDSFVKRFGLNRNSVSNKKNEPILFCYFEIVRLQSRFMLGISS